MQVPVAAQNFLELLEKSELLTAVQIRKVQDRFKIPVTATARETAKLLVRAHVLTPFQAERLLEGRYRGLVIDGYRIREVLGFGGMGCVFIAEDPTEDRKVAFKILSSDHALDAGLLTRMKLEAIAGMRLDHPNIVRTWRMATTGAVHYLVMELFRGISLHELVALHGALKWPMVCDMALQVAEALKAAHAHGIIHRDIKPANLLIDQEGVTRILDFGLALIKDAPEEEFSLSMLFGHDCLGTPDYIAPEQSLDSRHVDGRADIYSLGATLYVALTSHVPFPEKTNKAKLDAHRTKMPRNVCQLRPEIPPEVGALIAKMMEKDPANRYQSADELAHAVKPFAQRKTIQFDFRELVTLRAKQARAKAELSGRKSTPQRSSITSASGWLIEGNHPIAEATDSFSRSETPAIRQPEPDRIRSEPVRATTATATRPPAYKGPAPAGWRLQISGAERTVPLVKARTSIGSSHGADVLLLREEGVDSLQCWLEYDGQQWKLHQESKTKPTYVDGNVEARCTLRHGSRITFGGKTSLKLISLTQAAINRKRVIAFITGLIALLTVTGLGWWILSLAGML
ncbi:MAG: protein kinase [Planctomycetaceae bacterium]|nr:protein kinase [Planctomycetaceae bacterium]